MIYKDLCESYSLLQGRTQYFTRGDRCLDIFQLSDVYQMKMYAGS